MRKLFAGISLIAIVALFGGCATPLYMAAYKGEPSKVSDLLRKGVKINEVSMGATALMVASSEGHVEIVKMLLDSGADPNIVVNEVNTALEWAANAKHPDVVKLLLERGADLDLAIEKMQDAPELMVKDAITILTKFRAQRNSAAAKFDASQLPASEKTIKENPKAKLINISVMDLNTTSGLSSSEVLLLTDKLINSLVKAGFTVIERGKRDEILKEQGFQQSGACSESSCLVEVGQLLGVQKMIGGTIGKFGDPYVIELRLINVGSAKIEDSFSRNYKNNMAYLLNGMVDAAESFSKSIK